MIIEIQKPSIVRVVYQQEPSDAGYGSCLWAYYDFDISHGLLTIHSDCGFYEYRWPEKGYDFIRLMAGVDADYLGEKLSIGIKKPEKGWIRRVSTIYEEHVRHILKSAAEEMQHGKHDED